MSDTKYTVIYLQSVGVGSFNTTVTKMRRFSKMASESIGDCFDAFGIYDPVFLFEGWPKLEGEMTTPLGELSIIPILDFPCKNLG